jgi:hypothetical protein
MGYAWVAVLHYWMQLTFKTTLLIATAMPAVWLAVFHALLRLSQPRSRQSIHFDAEPAATGGFCGWLAGCLLTAAAGLALFAVQVFWNTTALPASKEGVFGQVAMHIFVADC